MNHEFCVLQDNVRDEAVVRRLHLQLLLRLSTHDKTLVFNTALHCEIKTITMLVTDDQYTQHRFLPARRYASAGYRDRNVSVCPSVCPSVRPSVRHAPVLCQNEES